MIQWGSELCSFVWPSATASNMLATEINSDQGEMNSVSSFV
jgi:hypothetical protein